jgi:1,2-diacylglycerol 3-beta-galactosyltransferase
LKRYLFFYLKTGGGHVAPAKAVAEKISRKQKNNIEVILIDGLANANPLVRRTIEDGYKIAVNKATWIFETLYAIHKIKFISRVTSFLVSEFINKQVENDILTNKPDKIVVFHFFLINPVYQIIKKYNLDISVITVVTDPFTAHPIWFLNKNQNFIVFSEMLKEKCLNLGIESNKIKVFPFVLDQHYSKKPGISKLATIRNELGFRKDSRIILIIGGGDGIPKGKKILKSIITNNIEAEIAVVCGRNNEMFRHISRMKEKYQLNNIKIYSYIDYVHSLISISDIVITKCGASTFMEILLMGKIQIINDYIWEQEKGNMEFVCKGKMGIFERDTKKLPAVINKLFNDKEYFQSHVKNIINASFNNGVGEVSDFLLKFKS